MTWADWTGSLHVKLNRGSGAKELQGRMFARGDRQRMDLDGGTSMIVDTKSRKAWTLIHPQKMLMEVDLAHAGVQVPSCGTKNIDACLAGLGYRKTGTDTVNGHPCSVYESEQAAAGRRVRIWRPTDLKEVSVVRSVATDDKGAVVAETNVTGLEIRAQKASLFTPPKDYRSIGNLEDLLKSGL